MASERALYSVGDSIVTFLRNTYPPPPPLRALHAVDFQLLSSSNLSEDGPGTTARTFLLYRVTVSEHLRNARPTTEPRQHAPLSLNLHYLMSAWADTAAAEQRVFGWAMRQLHDHPILDASSLTPEGQWSSDEAIHIIPAELATEDMMRLWDALTPSYRHSCSYMARVVRIDSQHVDTGQSVVARRLDVEDAGTEGGGGDGGA